MYHGESMRKLLVRWAVIVLSLFVAVFIVPGIRVEGDAWLAVAVMALVLGLINAILRPILSLLSCGCIVLTLGFFLLIINAFTLWFSSWIAVNIFGIGFYVDTFWAAFWGAMIVSVVTYLMSYLVYDR
jgi:putative membrane protein